MVYTLIIQLYYIILYYTVLYDMFVFRHVLGIVILIELVTIMALAIPITLDIAPINVTCPKIVHITSEYFVDHSKYYIPVMMHITITICIGAVSTLSISITLLSLGFHGCALFKIAK